MNDATFMYFPQNKANIFRNKHSIHSFMTTHNLKADDIHYLEQTIRLSIGDCANTVLSFADTVSTVYRTSPKSPSLPGSQYFIKELPLLYSGDKDVEIVSVFFPAHKSINHPIDAIVSLNNHCSIVEDELGYTIANADLDKIEETPLVGLAITTKTSSTNPLRTHLDRVIESYNYVIEEYGGEYTQGDHMSLDMLINCVKPMR